MKTKCVPNPTVSTMKGEPELILYKGPTYNYLRKIGVELKGLATEPCEIFVPVPMLTSPNRKCS